MAVTPLSAPDSVSPRQQAVRFFGRFQLLNLLGKSQRSMVWRVDDPRVGQELLLAMPRMRPPDAAAADRWRLAVRRATRLDHPSLAPVVEVGEHDRWPFVVYDPGRSSLFSEKIDAKGMSAQEAVPWIIEVLQGLAFAHEAGAAHHDLQPYMVLLPEHGPARLIGLGVAMEPNDPALQGLLAQRQAAERDVLSAGILMHHALAGTPALDQHDVAMVIERLPPQGRELVRLPWSTAHPVPEALRAIINRATDRQERHRYRNARTVIRALEGWLQSDGEHGGGPLAMLLDRMRVVGLLPAMPGAAQRAARIATMEREHNDALAELVLRDMALSFELMRMVNSAQVRGAMASGNGPILTIRRTIDMLGLEGVRRAAQSLRPWPGPLDESQAAGLDHLMHRVRLAGQVAQWLRPAGYDAEVVYLLAMLQNLGRLVVRYHFPDEANQIDRLMKPAPPKEPGEPEEPGMTEEAASFAVLGLDVATIGSAIARHWGLDDSVLHMMTRAPVTTAVHASDADGEMLRLSASCGNEVIDALARPPQQQASALQRVAQRYARVLGISLRDVQMAAQGQPPEPPSGQDARATNFTPL